MPDRWVPDSYTEDELAELRQAAAARLAPVTGVQRMFAIEGRMFRAQAGDRSDFDAHAIEDIHWLLTRCNEMWSLLPPEDQARFRDGPAIEPGAPSLFELLSRVSERQSFEDFYGGPPSEPIP